VLNTTEGEGETPPQEGEGGSSGCTLWASDTIAYVECCSEGTTYCVDSPSVRAGEAPECITLSGDLTDVWPGKVLKISATGGDDIDYCFSQVEDPYYNQFCGDCVGAELCRLEITNQISPFEWEVSGCLDGFEVEPEHTQDCYIATKSIYPFPDGNFPDVCVAVSRDGASLPEESSEDFSSTYELIGVQPPKTYLLKYTGNPDVIDQIGISNIEAGFAYASNSARMQWPTGYGVYIWPKELFEQTIDRSINFHLICEQCFVQEILPTEIDACYQEGQKQYYQLVNSLMAEGINLFFVDTMKGCSLDSNGNCINVCHESGGHAATETFITIAISYADFNTTLLHEIGNTVGLDDLCGQNHAYNIMYDCPPLELRGENIYADTHPAGIPQESAFSNLNFVQFLP